jgi:hypothetical protein
MSMCPIQASAWVEGPTQCLSGSVTIHLNVTEPHQAAEQEYLPHSTGDLGMQIRADPHILALCSTG